MNWLLLLGAGLLEVVWAVGLKYTQGFTKPIPSILTLVAMAASFLLLSIALRSLPLGTAYASWVGMGAVGTAIAGIVLFNESISWLKVASLAIVVVGIVGLKLSNSA